MLYSKGRPLTNWAFIIHSDYFRIWLNEQEILRFFTLEEIFNIFLNKDWKNRLWVIAYRLKVLSGNNEDMFIYIDKFLEENEQVFQFYRNFILKTMENITGCSLEEQSIIFLYSSDDKVVKFMFEPSVALDLEIGWQLETRWVKRFRE